MKRAIDVLVAIHVFGGIEKTPFECPKCGSRLWGSSRQNGVFVAHCHGADMGKRCTWTGPRYGNTVPAYCEDTLRTHEVIDALMGKGMKFDCGGPHSAGGFISKWWARFGGNLQRPTPGSTFGEAVCIAALRAVEVPELEIDRANRDTGHSRAVSQCTGCGVWSPSGHGHACGRADYDEWERRRE